MSPASAWQIASAQYRDLLGEGVTWSPQRGSVLWVDIVGQLLHELNLASRTLRHWPLPERVGWVLERSNGGLLLGLKSGIATLSLDPFRLEHRLAPELDRPQNRLNDAAVDSAGDLWFGTKDDTDIAASGALYRLDRHWRCTRQDDGYLVPNGPAISPDGRTVWHADSLRRVIYQFERDSEGNVVHRRDFIRFQASWGVPDGMALDREGHLWVAHWGGARVSRFRPDATLERSIELPTPFITNVAFAGEELDRMFVTSAQQESSDDAFAGALFEIDPDARGIPLRSFSG